jgi:hypothetical protein
VVFAAYRSRVGDLTRTEEPKDDRRSECHLNSLTFSLANSSPWIFGRGAIDRVRGMRLLTNPRLEEEEEDSDEDEDEPQKCVRCGVRRGSRHRPGRGCDESEIFE